ncbi:MAG: HPr(Ser) kinase/phosphatase, partial [Coraliomargaritaceae bacterium]
MNSKEVEALSVKQLYDSFREPLKLELVSGQNGMSRMIGERSLNRPALALTGFLKFFASKRIQLFGAGEMGYLRSLKADEEELILRTIFFKKIPCIIISRNLAPSKTLKRLANEFDTPLIRSSLPSKTITTELTLLLE